MDQWHTNQEQLIGYWVKSRGLKHKDLTNHPQIDDCILLIRARDSYWLKFTVSERAHWAAVWEWCYHKRKALKAKHLNKLEHNIMAAETRHTQRQQQAQITRQKIQARRNLCQTQRGDDMMAKAPLADASVPWEA